MGLANAFSSNGFGLSLSSLFRHLYKCKKICEEQQSLFNLGVAVIHFSSWAFSQNCGSTVFTLKMYRLTFIFFLPTWVIVENKSSVFYFLSTHMSNSGLADRWQRIGKHPLDRKQALGFPERRRRWQQEEEASQGWAQPCWDTDALWATTWRLP